MDPVLPLLINIMAFSLVSFNAGGLRTSLRMQSVLQKSTWDILCLQETRWDCTHVREVEALRLGRVFVALGPAHSSGVAVILKANPLGEPVCTHKDPKGRFIIIDLEGEKKVRLINIHAPNCEIEREAFFINIFQYVIDSTIIIGDFNTALSKLDISKNNTYKNDVSRSYLLDAMTGASMTEIWRNINITRKAFSRRQVVMGVLKQSRIDLCLISASLIALVEGMEYTWSGISDHALLAVSLAVVKVRRNGGLWVFNNTLLEDGLFVRKMGGLLDSLGAEADCLDSLVNWWEHAKARIKKLAINYSRHKRWVESREENETREKLRELCQQAGGVTGPVDPEYCELKARVEQFDIKKCKASIIRAKAKYAVEGERSTAFFFSLEKGKQTKQYIGKIENIETGKISWENEEILEEVESFYRDLFSPSGISRESAMKAIGALESKLGKESADTCDAALTMGELTTAIKQLGNNKSGCRRFDCRILQEVLQSASSHTACPIHGHAKGT